MAGALLERSASPIIGVVKETGLFVHLVINYINIKE
jgi:hypothetical protein